ncbi:hypothetical protein K438DRAFT_1930624 [Mycena galopus ATCC 62051]|nr:hypothetical protein K438DRAFT_1930624 [Mycena galopus ATCC 62051]
MSKPRERSMKLSVQAQAPDRYSSSSLSSDTNTAASSTSSSESESSDSDTESMDSAWEMDPDELVSQLEAELESIKLEQMTMGPSGIPPRDLSSSAKSSDSTEDAQQQKSKKGSAKTPRKNSRESEQKHKKRCQRNSRQKHHKKSKRDKTPQTYEVGNPYLAGAPLKQPKRWRKLLHAPYIAFFKATLGKPQDAADVLDIHRNIRLPTPEKYLGSSDVKIFERHIQTVCQWMQVSRLRGKEQDERRCTLHSLTAGRSRGRDSEAWMREGKKRMQASCQPAD